MQTRYVRTMKLKGESLPDIVGECVRLRWMQFDDAPALFDIFHDPEVVRYWSSPQMQSLKEAVRLVESIHEHFAAHTLYQWGVTLAGRDEVIGTMTLAQLDWSNRRCEIGFSVHRKLWGQGIGSEAAALGLRMAFETLDLRRVEADADPRNAASIGLLEKLGFVREGLLRERWEVAGEVQDSLMLGLLRREWAGRSTS